jgi:hypothetical protein
LASLVVICTGICCVDFWGSADVLTMTPGNPFVMALGWILMACGVCVLCWALDH